MNNYNKIKQAFGRLRAPAGLAEKILAPEKSKVVVSRRPGYKLAFGAILSVLLIISTLSVLVVFPGLLMDTTAKIPGKEDFANAGLMTTYEDGAYIDIPQICVTFNGRFNDISLDDFTDLVLTRNGIPVENTLSYNGEFRYSSEMQMTWFALDFEHENTEPGIYHFTGKYKDFDFETGRLVVEVTPLGDEPANSEDCYGVGLGGVGYPNGTGIKELHSISFYFTGNQHAFYMSDLTQMELTLNGKKIDFKIEDQIYRYLYVLNDDEYATWFTVVLVKHLTKTGTYKLTGYYMGKPFESMDLVIGKKDASISNSTLASKKAPGKNDLNYARLSFRIEDGVVVNIPYIDIGFKGEFNDINPEDFTDMKLTRNGILVENEIKYKQIYYDNYFNQNTTMVIFEFENENTKPGTYGFTGKYKGVAFEALKAIVEETPIGNEPANPNDIRGFSFIGHYNEKEDKCDSVSGIIFNFSGHQQIFNLSDLTSMELTLNNKKIDFEFDENVNRQLSIDYNDNAYTVFTTYFKETLTNPGRYKLTGRYMGVKFESNEMEVK